MTVGNFVITLLLILVAWSGIAYILYYCEVKLTKNNKASYLFWQVLVFLIGIFIFFIYSIISHWNDVIL